MKKNFYKIIGVVMAAFVTPLVGVGQVTFTNTTSDLTDATKYSGVAMCVQDMNSDRLDDIVCLDNARNLYIEFQNLDGTWTSYDGPTMDNGNAWGMTAGDADDNGYGDVFSGLFGGNPDYAQANATGTSWSVSELPSYGLATQAVTLSDFDHDGDLDFFSCGDTGPSGIWENDGNGNFTYSGDDLVTMTPQNNPGWGSWDGSGNYGSTATDYDLDGDTDFYITHCRQGVSNSADPRRINQMFINDGNGNFTEDMSNANGLRLGAQCWTTDFQDVDNDGDFDAFVTNHDVDNMLLINDNNVFTNDVFASSGLDMSVGTPIQGVMRDFDNDMYVDIIVTGSDYAYYHNNGDLTFTKIDGIFGNNDMESLAIGDLNHDGFLDVYGGYANIYTSPSNTPDAVWMNDGNDNNWIAVNLQGTISNRSAVGAVVRLYGSWGVQVREVRAGELYGVTNSLQQHFGLAQNTSIDSVVVDWPVSGIHQVISNPAPNQFLTIIENQCVAPEAIITSSGPTVICAGQDLTLDAPTGAGYIYEWSTGETTASILVNTPGTYMVSVDDGNGCNSVSPALVVEVSPDETPTVTAGGDLEFCEGGAVTLTSSSASSYTWSNQETSQSISVTQPGDYSVTIQGACDTWTSSTVTVNTFAAPMPTASDVTIGTPQAVTLTATGAGTEFYWWDAPSFGNIVGIGADYTTPVLSQTTSYWVGEVHTYGGGTGDGGKDDNNPNSGQYHTNSNNYLIFDANQDFYINTVKVYADGAGTRTIELINSGGGVVQSANINIPDGESVVTLDFFVPSGTDYGLRTTGNPELWRDNDAPGVNFPYPIATYGSITGTTVTGGNADNYYYFFYDWTVSLPATTCESALEEVVVIYDTNVGISEGEGFEGLNAYPNPVDGTLFLEFGKDIDDVISLTVTDVTGKVVKSEGLNNVAAGSRHAIDMTDMTSGSYIVRIQSDKGSWTNKIMVK